MKPAGSASVGIEFKDPTQPEAPYVGTCSFMIEGGTNTRETILYQITQTGNLNQLDTLDIQPLPGMVLKHFTARDVIFFYFEYCSKSTFL